MLLIFSVCILALNERKSLIVGSDIFRENNATYISQIHTKISSVGSTNSFIGEIAEDVKSTFTRFSKILLETGYSRKCCLTERSFADQGTLPSRRPRFEYASFYIRRELVIAPWGRITELNTEVGLDVESWRFSHVLEVEIYLDRLANLYRFFNPRISSFYTSSVGIDGKFIGQKCSISRTLGSIRRLNTLTGLDGPEDGHYEHQHKGSYFQTKSPIFPAICCRIVAFVFLIKAGESSVSIFP